MSQLSALENCKLSHGKKASAPICKGGMYMNQLGIMTCGDGYKCESGSELNGTCCLPIGTIPEPKRVLSTNKKIGIAVGGVVIIGLVIYLIKRK